MFAGKGDDLPVIFDCLLVFPADLVDQAETGVAVGDVGEALQQVMGGTFCFV